MLAAIPYKTFPEIDLGPIKLHTFGLLVGLGVLVGVWILALYMERTAGIDRDESYRFGFWVVVVGFVGARLTYVITNWSSLESPVDAIAVWKGGLQFAGGFLGGIALAVWWLRRNPHLDRWRLLDGIGLGLTAGLAIGRLGCYSVGEHLGGKTSFFLAVRFNGNSAREGFPFGGPNGGPPIAIGDVIHNTALYEVLHLAVLFFILLALRRRARWPKGSLFVVFLFWYGTARFCTDFLRAYDRTRFGLTGAQYMMIGIVIGALVITRRIIATRPGPMVGDVPLEEPDEDAIDDDIEAPSPS
jgi:phosphatidylglycerol:prolipoprotein diacylglycerol transferase